MPKLSLRPLLPVLAAMTLLACSPAPPPPAAPAAPAAQGEKELALYRTLREQGSWEYAAPIGTEIVQRFPGSAAATEVAATLAETQARAEQAVTQRRLRGLWSYQSGTESGGSQVSASIYSDAPAGAERVRLVLRRHSDWGQSVYLYGSGKGFVCRGDCTITARFDGKVRKLKAYRPDTGEPALFIADDKDFIARLEKARVIELDLVEQGRGERHLAFEVGGFEAAKFPALPRRPGA